MSDTAWMLTAKPGDLVFIDGWRSDLRVTKVKRVLKLFLETTDGARWSLRNGRRSGESGYSITELRPDSPDLREEHALQRLRSQVHSGVGQLYRDLSFARLEGLDRKQLAAIDEALRDALAAVPPPEGSR